MNLKRPQNCLDLIIDTIQELVLNKKPSGTRREAKTVKLITTFFITVQCGPSRCRGHFRGIADASSFMP